MPNAGPALFTQDQVLSLHNKFPVYSGDHFVDAVSQIVKERMAEDRTH